MAPGLDQNGSHVIEAPIPFHMLPPGLVGDALNVFGSIDGQTEERDLADQDACTLPPVDLGFLDEDDIIDVEHLASSECSRDASPSPSPSPTCVPAPAPACARQIYKH